MENTKFFDDEADEQERGQQRVRYLLALFLRLAESALVLGGVIGALIFLSAFLGWSRFILPCLLGLLAGNALAAAVLTSLQIKAVVALFLGGLLLPGLAVYVSFLAGNDPRAFDASSAALLPFVVYASAAFIGGLVIVKIWRSMPAREKTEEAAKGPVPAVTPALKEHRSHEGPDLDKVA